MEYRRDTSRKERSLLSKSKFIHTFLHVVLSQSKCIHTFYTQPDLRDDLLLLEVTQCPSSYGAHRSHGDRCDLNIVTC